MASIFKTVGEDRLKEQLAFGRIASGSDRELIEVRLTAGPHHDGQRLDCFIKACIPRLSRNRIQKMIRSQRSLGGLLHRPSKRVRAGEQIVLLRPAPEEPEVPRNFSVLYQDAQLLAINKPSGLPVHATARFHKNTLTALLRERFEEGAVPVLAHRLDRETSGLMLLGCSQEASIALKESFRRRQIQKKYTAIVVGSAPREGVIDLPLGPDVASGIRVKMAVVSKDADGQAARTRFRNLQHRAGYSLVEVFPETGRQHQIRAHLSALGFPIVGDKLYGPDANTFLEYLETGWTKSLEKRLHLSRQALHAAEARFLHPTTGKTMHLVCPLDRELQDFWDALLTGGPSVGR
jgi:23S rRNA pseudouridine1911/1915/1917 synthase